MKLELILFFVVACMAQKEDHEPSGTYPLLQDSFAVKATMPLLDAYILGKRELIKPCYLSAKKRLDEIALNLKYNLTEAEGIYKAVAPPYQHAAHGTIKTLIKISGKIKSCHKEIWEKITNTQFLEAAYVIVNCREKVSNLIGQYESQLEKIKNNKSKDLVKKKLDEIISKTEEKFDEVNEVFEKCAEDISKIQ